MISISSTSTQIDPLILPRALSGSETLVLFRHLRASDRLANSHFGHKGFSRESLTLFGIPQIPNFEFTPSHERAIVEVFVLTTLWQIRVINVVSVYVGPGRGWQY